MTTPEAPIIVNPDKVMVSAGNDLCVVSVTTHMGAEYRFPDMSEAQVREALPESGRIPRDQPALMMVNISHAVLTLMFSLVKEVRLGEEVVWASRA